ncbi:MAG: hypothetical protein B7C24_01225 [Bacteroidetes bacterium 4572_77]|nr:MAG: hypothetical protein B7C24_01225 [Bacteroidetes bacterium 4572_77]
MIDPNNPSSQTIEIAKNYINIKIDIVLLAISQKMSNAASYLIFAVLMGFIALFVSLFLSLSLSSWIVNHLGLPGIGNLIVSLIYIILGIILYVYRYKLVINPIKKLMKNAMDFSDLHNKTSIKGEQSIDESIVLLKEELIHSEMDFDENMQEIKDYYSFEQLKDRFISSILENPKSLLSSLLIIRELLKNKRKKK